MSLFGFFCGKTVFAASGKEAARIFNLCMEEKISYVKTVWDGASFLVSFEGRAASRFSRLCEREGITVEVRRRQGLPELLRHYRNRPGLLIGFFLLALLLLLSRGIIWNIRIEGADRLSEARILELLSENGVEVGSSLRKLNPDRVEGNILLVEKDISWISLYAVGTTLNVEIRETERGDVGEDGAANLVALCDGVIERIEVCDGNVMVKKGDVVRRGELLVSGVYDTPAGGLLRTACAAGEVYARTSYEFSVEIPLLYEKKVYTGREWCEKRINFFAKDIKVFANTGNAPPTCDIIYYEDKLSFFGGEELPLGLETVLYREYTAETVNLSAQSAAAYAFDELERELAELSARAELLEKKISFELTEEAYLLKCYITCVENIAVAQPIKIGA